MGSSAHKSRRSSYGFSNFNLKIIAVITMVIDHSALIAYKLTNSEVIFYVFKAIGRLSFPLFCFILVEGFIYTKSRIKHLVLLVIFTLISEPAFDFFKMASKKSFVLFKTNIINFDFQSVILSLLIGFLTIWLIDTIREKIPEKDEGIIILKYLLYIIIFAAAGFIALKSRCDYSYKAIVLIVGFYFTREHIVKQTFVMLFANVVLANIIFRHGMFLYSKEPQIQWVAMLSLIPIYLYNGKVGNKKMKYAFYIFYPAHLAILALISCWVLR